MSASDDYCDFCDLPRSQCIHGMPPAPPKAEVKAAPRPRARPATRTTRTTRTAAAAPAKVVNRRWSSPEDFKPLILTVLKAAGGELEADEMFLELEIAAEDQLRAGDRETTPEGELRWRYAARRARVALIDEGLMTKDRPGVWKLA